MLQKIKIIKNILIKNIHEKRLANSRLGVTYSVFNGEEMLPYSIESIRKQVDYINVIFQKTSWTGIKCSDQLITLLNRLKSMGLIDSIIEYKVAEGIPSRKKSKLVISKKNLGLKDLIANGCTHCMIMDADELYLTDEFMEAKKYIIENNITHSACNLYDYRYYPEIRSRDAANYCVPFIFKINKLSRLSVKHHMPCKVDGLRTIRFRKLFHKFYYLNSISMHHMTGIRIDYNSKLESSITNFTSYGPSYIKSVKEKDFDERKLTIEELINKENSNYIKVDNYFNIEI